MSSKASKSQASRKTRHPVEGLFCNYTHRVCMQNRLDSFDYCAKHILEDKNAPFKQCHYTSAKTGKRCSNAAPKTEKREGYCTEHARKATLLRQKTTRRKRPRETPESLLEELEHYTPKMSSETAEVRRSRSIESIANRILDYASSSDSDDETALVDQAWRGDGDSDAESVDSEQEDPLKHAGIYTAEEVALITRDKLIRLQSLYIDQFKRLQHVMREKRRKYLHTHRREKETLEDPQISPDTGISHQNGTTNVIETAAARKIESAGMKRVSLSQEGSVHSAKDDPDQREKYDKLMASKRYHKRHGKEALLHRQSKERRVEVSEGNNYKPPSYPKCVYLTGNTKCGQRTVPLSKYCFEHILNDNHQVLYSPCKYGSVCPRPVPKLLFNSSCKYHTLFEDIEYRLPNKKEAKEEKPDESHIVDVVGAADVKTEPGSAQMSLSSSEVDLGSFANKTPLSEAVREGLAQESETSSGLDGSESRSAGVTPTPIDQGIVVNLDHKAIGKDLTCTTIKDEPMDTADSSPTTSTHQTTS